MELEIREATASDYDDLCTLFDEGDALHRENLPHIFQKPKGPVRGKDYVLGLISDEAVGLFVAQLGDQVVGVVCVVMRESPDVPVFVPRRYAMVDSVVVRRSFRQAGIGRALMEKAHRWAVARGVDRIELNVWEFNKGGIEFYHKLGYETEGRRMSRWLGQVKNPPPLM